MAQCIDFDGQSVFDGAQRDAMTVPLWWSAAALTARRWTQILAPGVSDVIYGILLSFTISDCSAICVLFFERQQCIERK